MSLERIFTVENEMYTHFLQTSTKLTFKNEICIFMISSHLFHNTLIYYEKYHYCRKLSYNTKYNYNKLLKLKCLILKICAFKKISAQCSRMKITDQVNKHQTNKNCSPQKLGKYQKFHKIIIPNPKT